MEKESVSQTLVQIDYYDRAEEKSEEQEMGLEARTLPLAWWSFPVVELTISGDSSEGERSWWSDSRRRRRMEWNVFKKCESPEPLIIYKEERLRQSRGDIEIWRLGERHVTFYFKLYGRRDLEDCPAFLFLITRLPSTDSYAANGRSKSLDFRENAGGGPHTLGKTNADRLIDGIWKWVWAKETAQSPHLQGLLFGLFWWWLLGCCVVCVFGPCDNWVL